MGFRDPWLSLEMRLGVFGCECEFLSECLGRWWSIEYLLYLF
jgi:hypothetical protein